MKITSGIILFLILLYPFFYASSYVAFTINYSFVLYYYVPLTFVFLFLNLGNKPLAILKKNSVNLCVLLAIIALVAINTDDLRYSKPLLFFIYVLNLYLLSLTINFKEHFKLVRNFFLVFLVLSVLFLFKRDRYLDEDRYFAFLLSPTVYSVYAEVFLIIYLYQIKNIKLKIVIFLIAGFFIFITKTRLNLVFYVSIPFLIYYFGNFNFSRWKVLLIYVFCLNMLYPIYSYLVTFNFGKASLVSTRYEDGRDSSFGLRNYLNSITYDEYLHQTTVSEKLLGKGTERSRKMIIDKLKADLFTHNDFIRFTYDFGLICTLLLLVFLFRVARGHYISFILLLLYLFSFYHNMIYDFFLISVFIFYAGIKKEETEPHLNYTKEHSYG